MLQKRVNICSLSQFFSPHDNGKYEHPCSAHEVIEYVSYVPYCLLQAAQFWSENARLGKKRPGSPPASRLVCAGTVDTCSFLASDLLPLFGPFGTYKTCLDLKRFQKLGKIFPV